MKTREREKSNWSSLKGEILNLKMSSKWHEGEKISRKKEAKNNGGTIYVRGQITEKVSSPQI